MIPVITGIMGVAISLVMLLFLRRDKLHAHHGVFWFVIALGFALLGFAPGIVDQLASLLGVAYPPVLAFAAAIGLVVIKLLLLDLEHSSLKQRNERLIQQVGILEVELRQLREQVAATTAATGQSTD
ncbi:DUF2304 domain-containing protein [Mangrovimicrobium sediminis]|uniref:DUF2304 domain-containing protein n=1 Tax=Mangrovimicrobium sediminis TaxID=2562682 RepID=A0A4Z0M2A8_9GAMM|nr:DUF2304 domain-containing protein [Haliea sp. SAOS-164]TGD73508.1 DUF2304 domain-containing protein [Haliea sp. SAOS-164]